MQKIKKHRVKRIPVALKLKRREVLGLIGGTVAVSLLGCLRGQGASIEPTERAIATRSCVVRPQQTEGPYFVDEKLNHSDIRSNPSDSVLKQGIPLRLVFHVSGIDGNSCNPLAGATVDIWHCDALGVYSDVGDFNGDTQGQKFLRGYQVTDANGTVEFVTIYPG